MWHIAKWFRKLVSFFATVDVDKVVKTSYDITITYYDADGQEVGLYQTTDYHLNYGLCQRHRPDNAISSKFQWTRYYHYASDTTRFVWSGESEESINF